MRTPTALVVPCFNEADRLDRDAFRSWSRANPWCELVFVDDGSTDTTRPLLAELAAELSPRARLMVLDHNVGKAEAVRAGLRMARRSAHGGRARYLGFWDADLATPLEALPRFVDLLDRHADVHLVYGSRVQVLGADIDRDMGRHYFGRVAATAVSNLLGLRVYDTQCGAKLFRATEAVDAVLAEPFVTRWVFDVELLARWIGLHPGMDRAALERTVRELPLEVWRDVPGTKLAARDFARAPVELARIAWHYRKALRA